MMYKFREACIRLREGYGIYTGRQVRTPEDAINILKDYAKDLDREEVIVINLSASNRPINYHIVSIGSALRSVVDVPNIFKTALLSNAVQIIMIHNHPSGECKPSAEDIDITNRVYNASMILGVPLMDHLIVGAGGDIWSIRGSNPELFEKQTIFEYEEVVAE